MSSLWTLILSSTGLIGLVIVFIGFVSFIVTAWLNGLIKADRERARSLNEENKYLTTKASYLEAQKQKMELMEEDHQRQINNISKEIHLLVERVDRLESIKTPTSPQLPSEPIERTAQLLRARTESRPRSSPKTMGYDPLDEFI